MCMQALKYFSTFILDPLINIVEIKKDFNLEFDYTNSEASPKNINDYISSLKCYFILDG